MSLLGRRGPSPHSGSGSRKGAAAGNCAETSALDPGPGRGWEAPSHGAGPSSPGSSQVVVWKRYSDFRKLHGDLAYTHRNLFRRLEEFPAFPRAQVFGEWTGPSGQ